MNSFIKKRKQGLSLVETLIYVSIMTVMVGVILSLIVVFVRSNRKMKISKSIENSAVSVMERITREAHDAKDINLAQSVLGTSPGVLVLDTTDSSGNPRTVKFFLSSNVLKISENGDDLGPLTNSSNKVTSLIFRTTSNTNSKAVKIEMAIEGGSEGEVKRVNFYDTAILRSK